MHDTDTVQIVHCDAPDELARTVGGSDEWCAAAHIELRLRTGVLLADTDPDPGNAVPVEVAHGFARRYPIPILTAEAANLLLEEIAPLAQRILHDWAEEWNGHNMTPLLGENAETAEEEIEELTADDRFTDSDQVELWGVEGATNGNEVTEEGITAETTDDEIDAIEARIVADLSSVADSGVAAVTGLDAYLRQLRNELTAEEA